MTMTELIIVNGDVRPMTPGGERFEALATDGGRVVALGATHEIEALAGRNTVVLDAGGRTVLPGFIDAHTHLGLVAQSFAIGVDCRSPTVRSVTEIAERAAARARTVPRDTWLLLQGTTFQDELVEEGRFPTPDELTAASADHPIVYRSSLHHTIANRRALELAGIDENTPEPPSGRIERDETGRPTGVMAEMFDRFPIPEPTGADIAGSVLDVGHNLYLANGVTSIQEIWDSRDVLAMIAEKVRSRELPLRVKAYGWVPLAGTLEEVSARGLGGVDEEADWLEYGGVKLFFDGGTSAHTAAFYDDYLDAPGTRGALTGAPEELMRQLGRAHAHGAQVMVHAAGDRAYDVMLDAVEQAHRAHPRDDARHRIEHGANVAWSTERTQRSLRLGVLPAPNVGFIRTYGEFWEKALGAERARPCVPLATLLAAGHPVPGTSDTSGGDPSLLDPLRNMDTALQRITVGGRPVDPEERIDVEQALEMYTRHAAWAGRTESSRGTLETGKLADVVVLSERLRDDARDAFADVRVHHTIVGGRIVHTAAHDAAHDAIRRRSASSNDDLQELS
jgi:predicted amidohydrolase YtcJ